MSVVSLMPGRKCYQMIAMGLFTVSCLMMLIWAHRGYSLQDESLGVLLPIANEYAIAGDPIETPVTARMNNEETKTSNTTHDHFDKANANTPSGTSACTVDKRLNVVEEVCSTLANRDLAVNEDDYQEFIGTFINHDQRIVFAIVPKAGSRALSGYFRRLNQLNASLMAEDMAKDNKISHRHQFVTANQVMKIKGFNRVTSVPVTEVQRLFHNYTKLIQVRHPLQRFVGGYYQRVILRWKTEELPTDFPTFVEQVLNGRKDRHWMPYYTNTHACAFHYDVILKVETLEHDQLLLRDKFGWESTIDHSHVNPNFNITDKTRSVYYKYDVLLHDLQMKHPSLFNRLLTFLQPDMDMFGYTWDEAEGSSCCYSAANCC